MLLRGPKPRHTCRKNSNSPHVRAAGSTSNGLDCRGYPYAPRRRYSEAVTVWAALTTLLHRRGSPMRPPMRAARHVPGRAVFQ